MLPKPPTASPDTKLDVLLEAVLFLVRHSRVPNIGDALVADLHRTSEGDPLRRRFVNEVTARLRKNDELVAENDA